MEANGICFLFYFSFPLPFSLLHPLRTLSRYHNYPIYPCAVFFLPSHLIPPSSSSLSSLPKEMFIWLCLLVHHLFVCLFWFCSLLLFFIIPISWSSHIDIYMVMFFNHILSLLVCFSVYFFVLFRFILPCSSSSFLVSSSPYLPFFSFS